MDRPDYVKSEHLDFLDELMTSGQMSSFKVSQLLMHHYPLLSFEQVNNLVTFWIYTYSGRHEAEV